MGSALAAAAQDAATQTSDEATGPAPTATGFLAVGLREGAACVAIATAAHQRALLRALGERGIDVARCTRAGQLLFLDARELLERMQQDGRRGDVAFRAVAEDVLALVRRPLGELRVYGELGELLWNGGDRRGALALEAMWSGLAAEHGFSLLCAPYLRLPPPPALALALDEAPPPAPAPSSEQLVAELKEKTRALEEEVARRRALEARLAELEVPPERLLERRDRFLDIASHELKTPLTALQLQLQALVRAAASDAPITRELLQRRLSRASLSIARLDRLMDTLLEVSRLTGGRMVLDRAELDLAQLAGEVVGRCGELASASGTQLRLSAPAPVVGCWDRARLDLALTNLVVNAVKYGEGAPVEVAVASQGERATLRVQDGGPGIPSEDHSRVFERYQRPGTARQLGGLGLGLWMARELVQAHGGSISVESGQGQGAAFTITLP